MTPPESKKPATTADGLLEKIHLILPSASASGAAAESYRAMVELTRQGIFIVDDNATLIFVNHSFASALGYQADDLLGRSLFTLLTIEGRTLVAVQMERRRRGHTDAYELSLQKRDGGLLPCLISAAPLMVNGVFLGSLASVTDISQFKAVEGEMRTAKEFRETIINSITDHLVVIDPRTFAVVMVNDAFAAWKGRRAEHLEGRTCFEMLRGRTTPCPDDGLHCPTRECARLKRMVLSEKTVATLQGLDRTFMIATYPHLDGQGQVDLVVRLERDVTDRRRMEEALAVRSRQLQQTQLQLEKLYDIARERTNRRSIPELVQFLGAKVQELFPQAEPLFLIMEPARNRFLGLEECPRDFWEPLHRLFRRLEQLHLGPEWCRSLRQLREPQVFSYQASGDSGLLFQPLSEIYQSWVGVPILSQQRCLGLFLLGCHVPQVFSREDVHFLHAVFAQVAGYLRYLLHQEEGGGSLEPAAQPKTSHGEIIGQSKKMQEVYQFIDLVSGTDAAILITGENGAGKELVAHTIHSQSKRSRGPFVVANCSAYSSTLLESELFGHEKGAFTGAIRRKKGRLELAQGGTLFLDEIGDLSPATQVLLLRFLQDHSFERVGGEATLEADVRLLAATHKDLFREVQAGRFRDDLYYRLNVVTVHLPPLRERPEDIPLLCQHFLQKYGGRESKRLPRFSPDALESMMEYDWPGNVRQLENAVSHAVMLAQGDFIRRRHLPRFLKEAAPEVSPASLAESERRLILRVLKEAGWNKHEAARRLKVSRSTLYSKIKRYQLEYVPREEK